MAMKRCSGITGASPSDRLVSYPGQSLRDAYLSAELQSVYSAAPADWTTYILNTTFVNTFCRHSQLNDQTVLLLTIHFTIMLYSCDGWRAIMTEWWDRNTFFIKMCHLYFSKGSKLAVSLRRRGIDEGHTGRGLLYWPFLNHVNFIFRDQHPCFFDRRVSAESILGASPWDFYVSHAGHSLGKSYSSAEIQSVYSTIPANWAERNNLRPVDQTKKRLENLTGLACFLAGPSGIRAGWVLETKSRLGAE